MSEEKKTTAQCLKFPKPQDFVLSVRHVVVDGERMSGGYEHIRIPVRITLEKLADIINGLFAMYEGRAHGFFMDNRAFSDKDSYYSSEIADDPRYGYDAYHNRFRRTSDYRLCDALMGNPVIQEMDMSDRHPERIHYASETAVAGMKDKCFKYVYNMGSENVFQCKILKVHDAVAGAGEWESLP